MMKVAFITGMLCLCLACPGCWWKRDFSRIPDNKVLGVGEAKGQPAVGEAEKWILEPAEVESENLSVHTLIVDLGKEMPPARFCGRDAVILVRRGGAIVAVGKQRYFVESGATVIVPEGSPVEIKQHGEGGPFVGIVVVSPAMGDVGELKPGPKPEKFKPKPQDSE
ncbi:MAG TPA: hypothetical protein PL033_01470 [Candidatus Brocadiia bacterium]|nr:hypothetical protein [Candidatus Brocadiia bacterium]